MKTTTNHGLKKPDGTDLVNIEDLNYNADKLDGLLVPATTTKNGLMSKDDKTKLNNISAGANNYTHPATHPASMISGLHKVATSGSYNDLTNKPSTFPPATHTHTKSQINDFPTSLPANGGNADTVDGVHFHPGNDRPLSSNATPYFYAFNGGDDCNCYVKNTSQISVANADTVDGKHATDFAPSGFGLGGACINITNWNDAIWNGFYMGSSALNGPSGDWWAGYVICHNSNWVVQIVNNFNNTQQWKQRFKINGSWTAWKSFGGGGDYMGKQLVNLPTFTFSSTNSTFSYSNSKGGMLRLVSTFSQQNLGGSSLLSSLYVDGVPVANNVHFGTLFQSISSNESYYTHELIVPFEHTVSLGVSLASNRSIGLSAKAYINK